MAGIHDQDRIEALRRRLYERGTEGPEEREHFELSDDPKEVKTTWEHPPQAKAMDVQRPVEPVPEPISESVPEPEPLEKEPVVETVSAPEPVFDQDEAASMSPVRKKRKYRLKLVLAGVFFFIAAVGISSVLMIAGNKTISGENIAINLDGPFTIGGGEVLPLQITLTNNNSVPIQAATLIVEYPLGTQSVGSEGQELFIERLPLDQIDKAETINIPLRAVVFGEENDERIVNASIEYRVEGSNATFFKEAEPLRFKISSSPVVLNVAAIKQISSGQETDIELTVVSNSPTAVTDVLVKAEYPQGFDFTSATPEAVSSNNVWRIDSLEPEGRAVITIRGVLIGKETDERAMHFSVGIPSERDPFSLASIFTTGTTEFEIEQPFLDVGVTIGSSDAAEVVLNPGQPANVSIDITNTLEDTLYDTVVVATLSGNALADLNVGQPSGFYDSTTNTITWDISSVENLEEIIPGARERLTFSVTPDIDTSRTPQLDLTVSVKARRVSESQVAEQLLGTAERTIKVASVPQMLSEAAHRTSDTGPVPPIAEEPTTYTLSLLVENGTNEISETEVTTTLPTYVTWLDDTSGDGSVAYNATTRIVTWQAGEVSANRTKTASFRVSILPSTSQIGTTPTLMGEQRLKATDNFTGTVIRSSKPAVTTELSSEAGFGQGSGRVIAQ